MDAEIFLSEDELYREAVARALEGDLDDARWILDKCTTALRVGRAPHPVLAQYLADALEKIALNQIDAAEALHVKISRPKHRPGKDDGQRLDKAIPLAAAILWARKVLQYRRPQTLAAISEKQGWDIRTLERRLESVDFSRMEAVDSDLLWLLAEPYHEVLSPLAERLDGKK